MSAPRESLAPYPIVAALCPTFRHPDLLANSLALWNAQSYPAERRWLFILDDGGNFQPQIGENWSLATSQVRFPSLPAKYNALLQMATAASLRQPDVLLVWEDDDFYLPGYIAAHVAALQGNELSKPAIVLTDCGPGVTPLAEHGHGRFHSTLAFRRSLIDRVGGWIETRQADFDLQQIAKLTGHARGLGEPWLDCQIERNGEPFDAAKHGSAQFMYRWHSGAPHGQWSMRSHDDETWYERALEHYSDTRQVDRLAPRLDESTQRLATLVGVSLA